MRPLARAKREQKIERIPESGCWIWTGATNAKGYGINGEGLVHRWMYSRYKGEIPDGAYVLHRCDVRSCCNPEHLYVGTQKDNARDMHARGRHRGGQPPGEKHALAKLTAEAVDEIRVCYKLGYSSLFLAGCYGVTPKHINRVATGKRWAKAA